MLILYYLLHVLLAFLYHLFACSGTNLLTRCPVLVSCFLLFFVSEKLHRKYSRNYIGQKSTVIYSCHVHGDRGRDGGGLWSPHTTWQYGPTSRRARTWCGAHKPPFPPGHPFTYLSLVDRNPKYPIRNPQKVSSPLSSSTLDREGSGALPSTLPERRSSPEGSTSPCLPPV